MGAITVHAGSFPRASEGLSTFNGDWFAFPRPNGQWGTFKVSVCELKSVDIVTEQTVRDGMGPLGRGLVGLAVAGPTGLLLGALSPKSSNTITFVASFRDGRELLGTCEHGTFVAMKAALIDKDRRPPAPLPVPMSRRIDRWMKAQTRKMEASSERTRARTAAREEQLRQKWREQGYSEEQAKKFFERRMLTVSAIAILFVAFIAGLFLF